MKFRKKPVVIEAVQWTNIGDSLEKILALSNPSSAEKIIFTEDGTGALEIQTLEGKMRADVKDWIIKGIKGEFYPCKPDIFEATYEEVTP